MPDDEITFSSSTIFNNVLADERQQGALTKAKANLLVHEQEGRKRLLHLPSTAGPSLSSPFSERFFQHLSDILLPPPRCRLRNRSFLALRLATVHQGAPPLTRFARRCRPAVDGSPTLSTAASFQTAAMNREVTRVRTSGLLALIHEAPPRNQPQGRRT